MSEAPDASVERPRRSRLRRLRKPMLVCALAGALLAVGGYALRSRHSVSAPAPPPAPDLSGADPQIISLLERASAAVRAAPRSGAAWGTLGAALMTHKFHGEALACLAEAEKLQMQEPRWPYLQGIVLLSWQPDAAIPKLARAAELAGDAVLAPRLRLANLLLERGQLDDAEAHLGCVLRGHGEEPHALLAQGKLELARGRLPEALALFQRCAANPQTARASSGFVATIEQRLGHSAEAAEASRRVASLPHDPPLQDPFLSETSALQTGMQAWLTQADQLLKSGRSVEALALNEKTVSTYPQAAVAWQMLGQARMEVKDYTAAERVLRRAVELAPESAESHFQLGSALFSQGRAAEAAAGFRRSLALRPTYAPSHFNLGLCLASNGQHAEAIESFRATIARDATFADAHRQLGATLALEGKFAEAIASLRRAVELNPADGLAAQMLDRAKVRAANGR